MNMFVDSSGRVDYGFSSYKQAKGTSGSDVTKMSREELEREAANLQKRDPTTKGDQTEPKADAEAETSKN